MTNIIKEINLAQVLEATLFVSGEGVDRSSFVNKLEITEQELEAAVCELRKKFSGENGIHLLEYRNKLQLSSNPNYAEEIAIVLNPIREKALTKATLETMSIIAYKQPVTRLEIEEVRGVSSDYAVQVLLEHKLIEVVGRKDVIGKPLLFGTTDEFLKRFNLSNISDLPNQEEILDRINLIGVEEKSDSLYNEFELPAEEEIPEFLLEEADVEKIESEKLA